MMGRVRWSSHGWYHGKTPNSFCVGRKTYSDLQDLVLQRKAKSTHNERNISSHSSQRKTPLFLVREGRLTHPFTTFLWKRKRKAVHGQREFFIYTQSLERTPDSLSSVTATYSAVNSESLQIRKKKAMDAVVGQLVIPWETSRFFGLGKKTHLILQFLLLKRKCNTWWGETACHCMGNPTVLSFREEDSPDSLVCSTGKQREKQCMVTGISRPTPHIAWMSFFSNLGGRTHPIL